MKVKTTKTFPMNAATLITDRANVNIRETMEEQVGDGGVSAV